MFGLGLALAGCLAEVGLMWQAAGKQRQAASFVNQLEHVAVLCNTLMGMKRVDAESAVLLRSCEI